MKEQNLKRVMGCAETKNIGFIYYLNLCFNANTLIHVYQKLFGTPSENGPGDHAKRKNQKKQIPSDGLFLLTQDPLKSFDYFYKTVAFLAVFGFFRLEKPYPNRFRLKKEIKNLSRIKLEVNAAM